MQENLTKEIRITILESNKYSIKALWPVNGTLQTIFLPMNEVICLTTFDDVTWECEITKRYYDMIWNVMIEKEKNS